MGQYHRTDGGDVSLAAERHRSRTGEGQLVTLALKDVALATAGHLGNLAEVEINGSDRQKAGISLTAHLVKIS